MYSLSLEALLLDRAGELLSCCVERGTHGMQAITDCCSGSIASYVEQKPSSCLATCRAVTAAGAQQQASALEMPDWSSGHPA